MRNARKLTEGAILLAAFSVLLFLTIYIPVLGSILNFVLPLPFILMAAKVEIKLTAAFFLAAAVISFIAGNVAGLGLMLIYGLTGAVIGYMLQKNKSRTSIFIASTLTIMAGLVISYAVSVAFFHVDIIKELTTAFNQSVKQSEQMLKSMGREDQIKPLIEQNKNLLKMIQVLAPSYLIIIAMVYSFIIQSVCFPIAKRFGLQVEPWGKLRNLSFPRSILWYYLIASGAILLFKPAEGSYLYLVLTNATYTLSFFMVLQGLSFVFYILHQRSAAKGLGILVVILAFIIPIIHYIIMILGITDLGFDFRKRFEKKE